MDNEYLFKDCAHFWRRMGVKKEDNIIALSIADVRFANKNKYMEREWKMYYEKVYRNAIIEMRKPIYDLNRGKEGFLKDSTL